MSTTKDDVAGPCEAQCAVICIDGITSAVIRGFTPDISWTAYVDWLKRRRPQLRVIHLRQPHDWGELIMGRPGDHEQLLAGMTEQILEQYEQRVRRIVMLGFSLGGLRAIQVARRVIGLRPDLAVDFFAYVSFGTPFRGTGRPADYVLKHVQLDYVQAMLDVERNRSSFNDLIDAAAGTRLRILIGEIERDELISASSALAPAHWLSGRSLPPDLRWGTFLIQSGNLLRSHDGLLHDPQAIGYIDGLVDGLLPPAPPPDAYSPF